MRAARLASLSVIAALALSLQPAAIAKEKTKQMAREKAEQALIFAYTEQRHAFWSQLGTVDEDVIASIISPEFMGAPAWPTTRQSYLLIRNDHTTIIASDGLSDPFMDSGKPAPGFEAEVYLESDGYIGPDFDSITSSWQFSLLQNFAQNVAELGGINPTIERYGIVSFELPAPANMPERWITERGTVGALINIADPDRPEQITLAPGANIRIIALTILLPDETEYVIEGGASAREDIAQRLLEQGSGLVSSSTRQSVLHSGEAN